MRVISLMVSHDVIDAARRLGARGPFTAEELCATLGVSRATLYRRVDAKTRAALVALGLRTDGGEAARRARVLAAVRASIEVHGFEGFTVEDVARRARVGAATVYRQFGDRDGLVKAFMQAVSQRGRAWELARQEGLDVERDLAAFAVAAIEAAERHGALLRMALAAPPKVRARLSLLRDATGGTLEALAAYFERAREAGRLAPDVQPREAAYAFGMQVIAQALLPGELVGEARPAAVRARSVARIFARGVAR